jgi:acetyl esterase/lipase
MATGNEYLMRNIRAKSYTLFRIKSVVMRLGFAVLAVCGCALAAAAVAVKPVVRVVRNVTYLSGASDAAHKDTLDLYLPPGKTAVPAPVIVSLHGGALMEGDKAQEAFVGERFASAGFVTAVVNYRLSPGVSHPAHVEDAAAAFAWVKRHIDEYGGNPDQVFVIGHSAGAYLAALLALDRTYLASHRFCPDDIRGIVPVSAFYWVERPGVAPDRDKSVWGTDRKTWIEASPAHRVRAGAPPVLLLYADGDEEWRRQQNAEMADALRTSGNAQVEIAQIAGRTHTTIWSKMANDGDETAARIIQFVRSTIAPRTSF